MIQLQNKTAGKSSFSGKLRNSASAIGLIAISSAPVFAQDEDEDFFTLEEIVVTAQKRAENIQDVPIAVTALSSSALEVTGFDNLFDLSRLSPSLQLSNFGPIAFVTLRGIGNENTTAGGDPSVALHYDGVYIGRPSGTLFTAFDSERVEVLRGPQGTLYGRNATGGSINYITKKPTQETTFEGDLTYGDYDRKRVRLAANLPVNDVVSTRVVGFWEDRDGFTENTFAGGRNANDADNWGLRGHLLYDAGEGFSALISATYIESGGVGSAPELREPFPGSTTGQNIAGPPIPGTNNYIVNGTPLVNDLRPFVESENTDQSQDSEFLVLSATLEYDFESVTLKAITGYVESSYDSLTDQDYSPLPLAELRLQETSEAFSQEIQLLSNNDGPFNWILGGFYFHEDATRQSQFFGSRYDIIAAGASAATGLNIPSGFDVGGDITSESYAFFYQATYEVNDRLALTGGIRYTNDTKDGVNRGFQFAFPYEGDVNADFDRVTYRVAADYDVSDDVLLYASFSTGYKSGGINQVSIPALTNPVFAPETVEALEVGLKSQLLDRRLQFNTSVYRNKYNDLQFQVFGLSGPEAFNADGATVQGFEIEVVALPAEWLQFDGSLGYTDATFDDQIVQGQQLGGNRVQRTPEFTYNAGATASWDLEDGNGSMRLRAEINHTGSIFYTAFNRNGGFNDPGGSDFAEGYTNANFRLFWYSEDSRYSLEAYLTNAFNTVQIGNVFRDIGFLDIPGGGGPENITYKPPRQFGVTFGFNF
ncbi:TonB-dependent receptor [Kordiimonas aquimaris]|uniref:TonB-dependent receptor n=1 Tax=Kordiimonas aquimaris TaxID=707591 RepID=UPI0021CE9574|nr:TonB-dependent receptor [Kordiimonas aquimaris]